MRRKQAPLSLPIVVGKSYVRRDGVVVTAGERHPAIKPRGIVFVGVGVATALVDMHVWSETGRIDAAEDDCLDLVADDADGGTG